MGRTARLSNPVLFLLAGSLVLLACALGWCQPPPPADLAATSLEVTGLGKLELLPDQAEGDYVFSARLQVADPAALDLKLVFNHDRKTGDGYRLLLSGKQAQFLLVKGGPSRALASSGLPAGLLAPGQTVTLSLRRDDWRLSLLLDDQLVCRAYDDSYSAGAVAFKVSGAQLQNPVIQFLGEMYFEDGFMRTAEEQNLWRPASGQWQQESLRTDPQAGTMQAERSANAFSYVGRASAGGRALSVTGYWFWADYRWQVSLRPLGDGPCGLVALYRDPDNYVALRWTSRTSTAPDANRLQIVERRAGKESVLGQTPGGFWPDQWYRLALGVNDGWVRAYVDGEVRVVARAASLRQGKCGLLAEGTEGCNFDDVLLAPWVYFADDFGSGRRWDARSGKWETREGRLTGTGKGLMMGPPLPMPLAACSADFSLDKGAAGLVFGYQSDTDYCLLRYTPTGKDSARAELVRVGAGGEQTLAQGPAPRDQKAATRLDLVVASNLVTGSVNGRRVLQAALPADPTGRVGVFADSPAGAVFSFVEVEGLNPPPAAHVVKEFRDDKEHWEMASWATLRSPWLIPPALQTDREGNLILRDFSSPREFGDNLWWTKGDYFGDKFISLPLREVGKYTGTLRITLDAQPGPQMAPQGGFTLAVSAQAGSSELRLSLSAPDRKLGETAVPVAGDAALVEFIREGQFLQVWVNHKLALQAQVS